MDSGRKLISGTSPMEITTVSASRSSPSFSTTPFSVISLVKQGQAKVAPAASASSRSFPKAAGFWTSIMEMVSAPRRLASVATSHPTLPAPMITTLLPQEASSFLAASRKAFAEMAFSIPGTGSILGFFAPVATTTKSNSLFIRLNSRAEISWLSLMSLISSRTLSSSALRVSWAILDSGIREAILPPIPSEESKRTASWPFRVRCQAVEIPPGPAPRTATLFPVKSARKGKELVFPNRPRSFTSTGAIFWLFLVQDAMHGLGQRLPQTVAGKGVYLSPSSIASSTSPLRIRCHLSWTGIPVGQAV